MTKFKIEYSNHDNGSVGGFIVRESRERAEWSADLLRQCGYRTIVIEAVKDSAAN